MQKSRIRIALAVVALGIPVLLLLVLARTVLFNPEGFSRVFLRSGGRIVSLAANNPRGTALVLAALVLLTWGTVAAACGWEAWRQRSKGA